MFGHATKQLTFLRFLLRSFFHDQVLFCPRELLDVFFTVKRIFEFDVGRDHPVGQYECCKEYCPARMRVVP